MLNYLFISHGRLDRPSWWIGRFALLGLYILLIWPLAMIVRNNFGGESIPYDRLLEYALKYTPIFWSAFIFILIIEYSAYCIDMKRFYDIGYNQVFILLY